MEENIKTFLVNNGFTTTDEVTYDRVRSYRSKAMGIYGQSDMMYVVNITIEDEVINTCLNVTDITFVKDGNENKHVKNLIKSFNKMLGVWYQKENIGVEAMLDEKTGKCETYYMEFDREYADLEVCEEDGYYNICLNVVDNEYQFEGKDWLTTLKHLENMFNSLTSFIGSFCGDYRPLNVKENKNITA